MKSGATNGACASTAMLAAAIALAAAACVGALPGAGADGGGGAGNAGGSSGAANAAGSSGGVPGRGGAGLTNAGGAGGHAAAPSETGSAGSGGGPAPAPYPRLVIFYTRWGTSYPEWWPTGTERNFTLSSVLAPLERYKNQLIILSGLTNANVYTDTGSPRLAPSAATDGSPDSAMGTLLTASPVVAGWTPGHPSLDTIPLGCGASGAGPPLQLAVGQFGSDDNPGVSFGPAGGAVRAERDPNVAAMKFLGHSVPAPDPNGDIDATYPMLGQAQINVAVEALARSKTCVVTLEWGDDFVPTFLGLTQRVHDLSHTTSDLYSAVQQSGGAVAPTPFGKLQTFYAQMFLALLDGMSNTPVGAGTLLDQSVVMWISETGQGSDHLGRYIPVVIAGSGGGRLDVGRYIQIKPHAPPTGTFTDIDSIERTQGDLLAALGRLWGISSFGDPLITRQPLTEILKF
jgi:hypothetical protein